MTEMVPIGKVLKTQGIKGELKIFPYVDFLEHIEELDSLFIDDKEFRVQNVRIHKDFFVIKLEGIESIHDGEPFRGGLIKIPKERLRKLSPGEFFWHDLIGMTVVDEEGRSYGKIKSIFPTGSNDVFVIESGGKEILLPAIKDVIKKVALQEKRVVIHLMEGLFE
jgi:16S rRNA processing protein RimM